MALTEKKEWPPNIEKIRTIFPVDAYHKDVIFSYGETIYNPNGGYIDTPLLAHEAMHSLQQDQIGSPETWWDKYLTDKRFRMEQELEAYREQYRVFKLLNKDRNDHARYLMDMARDFSSPLYGSVISFQDAMKYIRQGL